MVVGWGMVCFYGKFYNSKPNNISAKSYLFMFLFLSGTIRPSSSLHTTTVSSHVIRRLQNFDITWTDERSHTHNNLDQTVSVACLQDT